MAANGGFLDPNTVLPPPSLPHPANVLDLPMDEEMEPTQSQTQFEGTSQARESNAHLWGSLLPCRAGLSRIDFWRKDPMYTFGRNLSNMVVIKSPKISNAHCRILWRGMQPGGDANEVVVEDLSTNGTWVNGTRIGKGQTMLLAQGNEISFGSGTEHPNPLEDHRYLYRHFGNGTNVASGGIFEEYQLSTELGKGAFASVRRAHGIKDGKTYAVKIIQQRQWAMNPATQKMFAREMAIMSTLHHPCIVQWYNTYYDTATIFLVMEFVDGKDLLELVIGSGNGLDETLARCITRNICDGVGFLHENNIVHRDLKPENVLISTGPPLVAKIADFGLAKVVDDQTMLRTTCGTPIYLAPEVVLSNSPGGYTAAVDSWSCGVIVYSMLTMAMPFAEEDEELDIRERMRIRVVLWEHLEGAASVEANKFCRGMIEPNPTLRMTMAQALAHPWLNDPYIDLAHGWTEDLSRQAGQGGSRGGPGGPSNGPRGFNSYRRANGGSAYDNASFYSNSGFGAGGGDMGSMRPGVPTPEQMLSASEVEAQVLGIGISDSSIALQDPATPITETGEQVGAVQTKASALQIAKLALTSSEKSMTDVATPPDSVAAAAPQKSDAADVPKVADAPEEDAAAPAPTTDAPVPATDNASAPKPAERRNENRKRLREHDADEGDDARVEQAPTVTPTKRSGSAPADEDLADEDEKEPAPKKARATRSSSRVGAAVAAKESGVKGKGKKKLMDEPAVAPRRTTRRTVVKG